MAVLLPFLNVILSDQTTGPITAAALASVQQIVSSHLLGLPQLRAKTNIVPASQSTPPKTSTRWPMQPSTAALRRLM